MYDAVHETVNVEKKSPHGMEGHSYGNTSLPEASKINAEQGPLYVDVPETECGNKFPA